MTVTELSVLMGDEGNEAVADTLSTGLKVTPKRRGLVLLSSGLLGGELDLCGDVFLRKVLLFGAATVVDKGRVVVVMIPW